MTALRAFHEGIVDYAGLFPPAKLPLDEAIRNYAAYRDQAEAWMLARFIIPAPRLEELAPYHDELFTKGAPFAFSILTGRGDDEASWLSSIEQDMQRIQAFVGRHGDRVVPEALELKLPASVHSDDQVCQLACAAADRVDELAPNAVTPFYEVALTGDWREQIEMATCGLSIHNLKRREAMSAGPIKMQPAGLKLRCGGVTPDAFPDPAIVTHAIYACSQTKVPLKATAGLHHPVRHFNEPADATMHGFFNVFGAGVFAHAGKADAEAIARIIEDQDETSFRFDETSFGWKHLAANLDEIRAARASGTTSFGSCSFDEPRDDLRTLGLL